LHIPKKKKSL